MRLVGEPETFRTYTAEDGLLHNYIESMAQAGKAIFGSALTTQARLNILQMDRIQEKYTAITL